MTPELQMAIKILRLSRVDLCNMVRDKMLENPILKDSVESSSEQVMTAGPPAERAGKGADVERVGETVMPAEETTDITPDVYVRKVGDKYFVAANDDGMPKVRISDSCRTAIASGSKAREYIQEQLRSAQWLIRSIQQRQLTVERVTESILKFQREFFDKGIAHLKPLILRDVAEDVRMHQSVVSLVATNKYVHTPQGIYELKYFFSLGSP